MDQHAHRSAGLLPEGAARRAGRREIARDPGGEASCRARALYAGSRPRDPLPHGWHVTSDSIAAWVAARLCAPRLVPAQGRCELARRARRAAGCGAATGPRLKEIVDEYFEKALEPGLRCWAVSGRHPRQLAELLRDEQGRPAARPSRAPRARPDARGADGPAAAAFAGAPAEPHDVHADPAGTLDVGGTQAARECRRQSQRAGRRKEGTRCPPRPTPPSSSRRP